MTRKEAIEHLNTIGQYYSQDHSDPYEECEVLTKDELDAIYTAIEALEQQSCEDEYIKVPKRALKYRTAGMVAYNTEWLKNHFDIERDVICGAQEPCEDAISREAVCDYIAEFINHEYSTDAECEMVDFMIEGIQHMPPVKTSYTDAEIDKMQELEQAQIQKAYELGQEDRPTGHWIIDSWLWNCSNCGEYYHKNNARKYHFCPNCGAKMESEDKE